MPEIIDSNELLELHESGEEYRILRIENHGEVRNSKYAYGMKFFVLREDEEQEGYEFSSAESIKNAYNIILLQWRKRVKELEEELKQMNTMKENPEEVDNIISFEAVKAKMGNKEPPDGNWLKYFKAGTRFLAYSKTNTSSVLGDFILGTEPKELPAVYLGYENGPQNFSWRWHDPVKFCKEFGLYSILEVSDGNSDKLPEGTVEGDGKPEVIHLVHETE